MKKILIVDDQLFIRKLVLAVLKSLKPPLTMEACESPEQALAKSRQSKYDLIFTDLVMPGMNGNELITAIRGDSLNASTHICVLSGTADQDDLSESRAVGADAFILKPIRKEILLMVAEKLLK